jgi:hypothetical protein
MLLIIYDSDSLKEANGLSFSDFIAEEFQCLALGAHAAPPFFGAAASVALRENAQHNQNPNTIDAVKYQSPVLPSAIMLRYVPLNTALACQYLGDPTHFQNAFMPHRLSLVLRVGWLLQAP